MAVRIIFALGLPVALRATSGAAGAPTDDWLARLNAPTAIPRQHDWKRACRGCEKDFYSPSSIRLEPRSGTARIAVEHRDGQAYSRRHVLMIDCRDRTVVEGHTYRFSGRRFVRVDTFEYDADASPWSDFADDYAPLFRKVCARVRSRLH